MWVTQIFCLTANVCIRQYVLCISGNVVALRTSSMLIALSSVLVNKARSAHHSCINDYMLCVCSIGLLDQSLPVEVDDVKASCFKQKCNICLFSGC